MPISTGRSRWDDRNGRPVDSAPAARGPAHRLPHIALRITEGTNSTIEPQLVNGQLDLAVLAWPVLAPELAEVDLFSEDLVVIVDKRHEIARTSGSISLSDLSAYELLLPLTGTPIRREIDEACRVQGVKLRALIELDGIRTIASMTFDGYGRRSCPPRCSRATCATASPRCTSRTSRSGASAWWFADSASPPPRCARSTPSCWTS